jgi:hypothetical protein
MKFTVLRPLQHEHGAAENGGVRLPAMKTPAFFEAVPAIVVIDPLAETLGAAENGVIEYHYRRRRQARRTLVPDRGRCLADDTHGTGAPVPRR